MIMRRRRTALTAFSWGYEGWGRSVPQLLRLTEQLEYNRGFAPPFFVDIRLRRMVRAPGFVGRRFEQMVGPDRHRHMEGLGNQAIADGGRMRLADPAAVPKLFDLIERRAAHRQRVIFFCSCGSPEHLSPAAPCHRTLVIRELRALARRRHRRLLIDEWPGGTSQLIHLAVTSAQLRKARSSKATDGEPAPLMTLGNRTDFLALADLGHLSLALLHSANDVAIAATGPPVRRKRGWCLPIYATFEPTQLVAAQRWADRYRARLDLPQRSWSTANSRAGTELAPFALYTIRHPHELDRMAMARRPVSFTQGRVWRTAHRLLELARTFGLRMPVLFADATECSRLTHVGLLDNVQLQRDATRIVVSDTHRLSRLRAPQELTLLSTQRTIAPGFIRPYALVATPSFARTQLLHRGHR